MNIIGGDLVEVINLFIISENRFLKGTPRKSSVSVTALGPRDETNSPTDRLHLTVPQYNLCCTVLL